MAKIISSKEKIDELLQKFGKENPKYLRKQFYEVQVDSHWVLDFVLHGCDCSIDIYFKKKEINIIPRGKNKDKSNILIDFIRENSYNAEKQPVSIYIPNAHDSFFDDFDTYLKENSLVQISISEKDNRKIYESKNGDKVYFQKYMNNTILVQTKPFVVFNMLMDFLSINEMVNTEEIVEWNKKVLRVESINLTCVNELKTKLSTAYDFFPSAIQKTLNSSYIICKASLLLEDYSVSMAGIFRALEAFIKMILEEYGYKLKKQNTFGMFHSDYSDGIRICDNHVIPKPVKDDLVSLHRLYSNKRNIYLHVPLNTMSTPIIEEPSDMMSVVDEILETIRYSHERFIRSTIK